MKVAIILVELLLEIVKARGILDRGAGEVLRILEHARAEGRDVTWSDVAGLKQLRKNELAAYAEKIDQLPDEPDNT